MKTLEEILLGAPAQGKDGEDALKELVAAGRIMQDLVASEGWKEFEKFLLARQGTHVQQLMSPIQSEGQVFIQESNKGAIHALAWALGLPSVIIQESKQILAQRAQSGNGKEVKHAPLAP